MKLLAITLLLAFASCFAQTPLPSPINSGGGGGSGQGFVYTGALSGIPATCTVGQIAFITDASAGSNIYECASTNTWTQQTVGAGAGVAPYSTATITSSPMSITAVTHGQGKYAFGLCWDASTNPQIEESCNWSRNPTTGDLTLTYSTAPAQIDIFGATGGFVNPMAALGAIIYGGASGAATSLPGNTTSTLNIFTQTGTGSVSAAPAWATLATAGIAPSSTAVTAASPGVGIAHFAGSTQAVTSSAVSLAGGANEVTGLLPLANGGTNCAAPYVVNPQTTTYQAVAADFTCFKTIAVASGTFTLTLVASGTQPVAGTWVRVINYGSGVVTIARSGQNINGGTASIVLQAAPAVTAPTEAFITSDGTNYFAGAVPAEPTATSPITISAAGVVACATCGTLGSTTQTTTYNIAATDNVVLCNSTTAFTVSLPTAAVTTGKVFRVKNINTGICTVNVTGGVGIDGGTTYLLSSQYQAANFAYDGAQYWIF